MEPTSLGADLVTNELEVSIHIADQPSLSRHSSTQGQQRSNEPTIKTLYGDPSTSACSCCIVYGDTPPEQITPTEEELHAASNVAVRVYKIPDHTGAVLQGSKPMKVTSVEIESSLIIKLIKDLLTEAGIVAAKDTAIKLKAPFEVLYFSYDKITAIRDATGQKSDERAHIDVLIALMDDLFEDTATKAQRLLEESLITFPLVWTLFEKGSTVYSRSDGEERLFKVVQATMDESSLTLSTEYVLFDGKFFGWAPQELKIFSFEGTRSISSLPVIPLAFTNDETLDQRLLDRARKAIEFQAVSYQVYNGLAVDEKAWPAKTYSVTGRVIIDPFGYGKYNIAHRKFAYPFDDVEFEKPFDLDLKPGTKSEVGYKDSNARRHRPPGANTRTSLDPPDHLDGYSRQPGYLDPQGDFSNLQNLEDELDSSQRLSADDQDRNRGAMLQKKAYMLYMSPFVYGFSLKLKMWLRFRVEHVKPMVWNDEAYSHLVYPEEEKDLVLTFVANHNRMKSRTSDDVVAGKGQGLILLLSGPPGTGKTLTAEAVADKAKKPLYYLHAEELGTSATVLGPNLVNVFELATDWNAIVLLDEADVFLSRRSPDSILRNELVSIFLRELEYFCGIIFMTTNLLSTIDEAFQSRIHIQLLFPKLSAASRASIWQKFIARQAEASGLDMQLLSEEDVQYLASWNLNGRQIKNAVKTTVAWCICKDFKMERKRLQSGIRVTAPLAARDVDVLDSRERTCE